MALVVVALLMQEGPFQDLFSREPYIARGRATLAPRLTSDVEDQNADFAMGQYEANVGVHVWGDTYDDVSVFASTRFTAIDTQAVFEDTVEEFPDELWDIQGGVTYRHRYDGGQIVGGRLSVGSATDEPFTDIHVTTFSASGFLRLPAGETDSWLFFLAMSNNSTFVNWVPIPGIAYVWVPSEQFRATIGLPFLYADWRPLKELAFTASYVPIHNARVSATWHATEELQLYVTGHWATQSWLRENRPDDEDRLYYDEKQVTAGARWTPAKGITLHVSAGYAMDREWSEGEGVGDDDAFNEIELESGAFATIGIECVLAGEAPPRPAEK